MREHINCLMKVEETGQIGRYVFAKTALRIGREFANSSQRLSVDGLDGIKGCLLGRYGWMSRLEKQDSRRWFLPVMTLCGKLGQPNGPSLKSVLELAELRKAQGGLAADVGDRAAGAAAARSAAAIGLATASDHLRRPG